MAARTPATWEFPGHTGAGLTPNKEYWEQVWSFPGILLECILTSTPWMRSDFIQWSIRSFIITLCGEGQRGLSGTEFLHRGNVPVWAIGFLVCVTMGQSVPISLSTSRLQNGREDTTHSNTGSKIKSMKFFKVTEKYLGNMRLLIKVRWRNLEEKRQSFGNPVPWLAVTEVVDSEPGQPHKSDST